MKTLLEYLEEAEDYGTLVDQEHFVRFSGGLDDEALKSEDDNEVVMDVYIDEIGEHLSFTVGELKEAAYHSENNEWEINGVSLEFFDVTPMVFD